MRRCSLARHRRPSGVESHSLTAVGSLLMARSCLRGPSQFNATISRRGTATPCATGDPRYDTVITCKRAPALYEQQQQRAAPEQPRPPSFSAARGSALVSACQSVGPRSRRCPRPRARSPVAAARAARADRAAVARVSRRRRRARLARCACASRFALEIPTDPAVERERDWYARNQAYLDRVFNRADLYLFHIVGALEARGMPAELALLPIVESAFDPFAYSHGRAAGLWQIIPGTGKRLGLAQNWWFDGRRDVLESTRAALDYLEQLHAAVQRRLAARGRRLQLRRRQRRPRAEEGRGRRQAAGFLGHQELPAGRDAHLRAAPARGRRRSSANPGAFGVTLPRAAQRASVRRRRDGRPDRHGARGRARRHRDRTRSTR